MNKSKEAAEARIAELESWYAASQESQRELLKRIALADRLAEAARARLDVWTRETYDEMCEALSAYESENRTGALRVLEPDTPEAAEHGDVTVPQGSHPSASEVHPDTERLRESLMRQLLDYRAGGKWRVDSVLIEFLGGEESIAAREEENDE